MQLSATSAGILGESGTAIGHPPPARLAFRRIPLRRTLADIQVLFKLRLNLMAVLPAAVTYVLTPGRASPADLWLLLGGLLAAGFGASCLNQWSERTLDARMHRTRERPVPARRMRPLAALYSGLLLSGLGMAVMAFCFTPAAALLTLLTLILYWRVYTPMKRWTPWNTEVGAVAGAMPALVGAAAAGGVGMTAVIVFALVFLWQMPHFQPIAWCHRKDYARAGYRMRSVVDPSGRSSGGNAVLHAALMLPVALAPLLWPGVSPAYGFAALCLSLIYLWLALDFRISPSRDRAARRLFHYSLFHLPALLCLLLLAAPVN